VPGGTRLAGGLAFALGIASLSLNLGPEIHVPLGGGRGPLMMSGLEASEAALNLSDAEVADGRRNFYFRQIRGADSHLGIPLVAKGPLALAVRMDTTVGTRVVVKTDGAAGAEGFVAAGRWEVTPIATELRPGDVALDVEFRDAPLVRRDDNEIFRRYIDEVTVSSPSGFGLPWESRIAGGLLLLTLALIGASAFRGAGFLIGLAGSAGFTGLMSVDPMAIALALPRLLLFTWLSLLVSAVISRVLQIEAVDRARVLLLSTGVLLACGFLSFLPNHSPADLDIHIWRTADLATVPPTYDGWLRYGSHYPTPSQARGAATEALGQGPAIPYSPLPYVLFYAAHAAGLDLHWSMNAIEACCLALLVPLVFAVGRAASNRAGGLLCAILMATDLATIHHLGRAHTPAVAGGAIGLACLLGFGLTLPTLNTAGAWRIPTMLLGAGALGYSSTPVFYALFGLILMAALAVRIETRQLLSPVAITLVAGGIVALILFYGHYVPGLLGGASGGTAFTDPFPGRTFFVFHNESRQSLRLWRLGLYIPLLAAVPALGVVFARCSSAIRAFLLAWFGAWVSMMLLKEPWGLPLLLRWAKEDFYVAPGLALLIGVGIARIESSVARRLLTTATVVTAVFLRLRDYGYHADTLRFLQ
jgi:hypothetical protein